MILCCLSDSQTFLVEEDQGGRRYFVKMLPYHPMMQKMARTSLAHQVGLPYHGTMQKIKATHQVGSAMHTIFEAAGGHQIGSALT
jgi:hypothetical protein